MPKEKEEVKISNIVVDNASKLISENSQTQKYELANGSIFLLTPNDANDIVAIDINAKGGEFIEKIPGVGKLTATVMLKGTKKYSSAEIAKIMEDSGIKISPKSKKAHK